MNCNVIIERDFGIPVAGQRNYQAAKGEVFTGTANKGNVTFHVTMPGGKIHPVSLEVNDWRIEVIMFKNQNESENIITIRFPYGKPVQRKNPLD